MTWGFRTCTPHLYPSLVPFTCTPHLYPSLVPLTKHPGDEMKVTEMSRACGTFEEEDRCIQCFGGEI
jgi:hypothetical protein